MTRDECINKIAYKLYSIMKGIEVVTEDKDNYNYACRIFEYFENPIEINPDFEELFKFIYEEYKKNN